MKFIIKSAFLISLFFFNNNLFAETNIVYLDLNIIYNETKVGKLLSSELEKLNKKNISNFKKDEELLAKEEKQITSQKNILAKEEYEKKVLLFRKKVDEYKSKRNNSIKELNEKRTKSINKLSIAVNKILAEYSVEKKISLILPKKNIIIGKSELDITKNILLIVDKKIKKIEIN